MINKAVLNAEKHQIQQIRQYLESEHWYDKKRKVIIGDRLAQIPLCDNCDTECVARGVKDKFGFVPVISLQEDRVDEKSRKSKIELLHDRVANEIGHVDNLPKSYEIYNDLVLLPSDALTAEDENVQTVLKIVCDTFRVKRVARKNAVVNDKFRSPRTDLLLGTDPWVYIVENQIKYNFDITKSMFCRGNITEKMRLAKLDCSDEVVVDLFAGIGYFVLPYLVHAGARHVFACEWNPNSIKALEVNLENAGVRDRCTVLLGDNREVAPELVADRVNLGLIPSSQISWETAVKSLKMTGGVLHIHMNVEVKADTSKVEAFYETGKFIEESILELLNLHKNGSWTCGVTHTECVKSYAPRIYHVVYDLECGLV